MVGTLIGIVLTLIIVGVIYWGITQLLPLIPLPDVIRKIVDVLLVIILVLIVIWVIVELLTAAGFAPHWGHLTSVNILLGTVL